MILRKLYLYLLHEFNYILPLLIKLGMYLLFDGVNMLILFLWIFVCFLQVFDPELCRNPAKYANLPSLSELLNENYSRFIS